MPEIVQELDTATKTKLLDFWDSLPVFKDVTDPKQVKAMSSPVRSKIIAILAQGMKVDNEKTRRALTANEILQILEHGSKLDVTKSNLYYHLQKLIDVDLVQIVLSVQTGNILTSYYGRTSKLILVDVEKKRHVHPGEDHTHSSKKVHYGALKLLSINPGFLEFVSRLGHTELTEIQHILSGIDAFEVESGREFKKWIMSQEENLQGIDLNLVDLFRIYTLVRKVQDFGDHIHTIGDWLEIK